MANQITDNPNEYEFGLDFNYAVWTPGTSISMVNVPWNNEYRDIVRFATQNALDTYIDSLEVSGIRIEKLSYVKPNMPVRINVPVNRALRYNYLRASNPIQPVPGGDTRKSFYYFITDVRYLSPNTTELILQLDVWQTFGYDAQFGTAYVQRGHIGIANTKNFDAFGRDYLTVPEGLNLGNEYRVIAKRSEEIMGASATASGVETHHDILVVSTTDLNADPGTVEDPSLSTSKASEINYLTSGAGFYVFNGATRDFYNWLDVMRDKPWVTQGIISVTNVPKLTRYIPDFNYTPVDVPIRHIETFAPTPIRHKLFSNWRNSSEILNYIPARYRHLKKFFTFPYMTIEMTTWSGTPVALKPEAWADSDAFVMERATFVPPNQRVQFYPRRYNSSGQDVLYFRDMTEAEFNSLASAMGLGPAETEWLRDRLIDLGDDFGDYLDIFTQIANFPAMPVVNSGALNYLASNSSQIAWQRSSAGWTQQRALRGAQTSFDQASKGLETARALTDISINADIAQTGNVNRTQVAQTLTTGIGRTVSGAVSGLGGGGIGAALGASSAVIEGGANMINAGIQTAANDEALGIRNSAAMQNLGANQSQGGFIRDTNKSLADWAARGDYANEIAAINARVEDAEMIQPTVSGQFGGDAANIAHNTAELSVRWKLIDNATIRRIGEFWLRYGYAVDTVITNMPADMMVMSKFTYWQMKETYLLSSPMPELYKQTIRGIFEKGVTVWRNPNDIGRTDFADNTPLGGISY